MRSDSLRHRRKPKHLPPGLTATVGVVEEILGQVVREAEGQALFDVVEGVRREMVAFREAKTDAAREQALDRAAGPVPPTGKQVEADYVYVMDFEGDRIRHMTKIWHDGISPRQLGWA